MKNSLIIIPVLSVLSIAMLTMARPAPVRPGAVLTAQAVPQEVSVLVKGTAIVPVRLTIPKSYHVNANPASEKYLIPTQVIIQSIPGVVVGRAIYPKATPRKFSFSDKPLLVYEGSVMVKVPVSVPQGMVGPHRLVGTVKYQACNERACLPPATAKFAVTIQVRGLI